MKSSIATIIGFVVLSKLKSSGSSAVKSYPIKKYIELYSEVSIVVKCLPMDIDTTGDLIEHEIELHSERQLLSPMEAYSSEFKIEYGDNLEFSGFDLHIFNQDAVLDSSIYLTVPEEEVESAKIDLQKISEFLVQRTIKMIEAIPGIEYVTIEHKFGNLDIMYECQRPVIQRNTIRTIDRLRKI